MLTPILCTLLLGVSGLLWTSPANSLESAPTADWFKQLPELGNSQVQDRLLLREISDTHVHEPSSRLPVANGSQSSESLATDGQPNTVQTSLVWELIYGSRRLLIPENRQIADYRRQYQQEALYVSRILQRASPFIGYIVDELDRRYLPIELALLPAIESSYQPDIHSQKDALGIWQILEPTAKEIGVTKTDWFDGRSDIVESTRAAVDYLAYLNAEFNGDWELTLAAYNAGIGRVSTAIKRNRNAGKPTDFWSLRLPRETQEYVPKFLALVALLRHDRPENLTIPNQPLGRAFELVEAPAQVSLEKIAQLSGISEDTIRRLNAGLLRGVTPPDGPHYIYMPRGRGHALLASFSNVDRSELYGTPEIHTVVAGDNLTAVASQYQMKIDSLKKLNSLESDLIKIGQRLKVFDLKNDTPSIDYVVTIGDTLSHIAQRFSVSTSDIRDDQGRPLSSDVIHPGERLSLLMGQ